MSTTAQALAATTATTIITAAAITDLTLSSTRSMAMALASTVVGTASVEHAIGTPAVVLEPPHIITITLMTTITPLEKLATAIAQVVATTGMMIKIPSGATLAAYPVVIPNQQATIVESGSKSVVMI